MVPISSLLTQYVYLLPFFSYLVGFKSVSTCPPRYNDNYCSRGYCFVDLQKQLRKITKILAQHHKIRL